MTGKQSSAVADAAVGGVALLIIAILIGGDVELLHRVGDALSVSTDAISEGALSRLFVLALIVGGIIGIAVYGRRLLNGWAGSRSALSIDAPPTRPWPLPFMLAAFSVGLLVQGVVLPSLDEMGDAKMKVATILDILIWLRVLAAWIGKERSGAMFYALLWMSSAGWIELAFWIAGVLR